MYLCTFKGKNLSAVASKVKYSSSQLTERSISEKKVDNFSQKPRHTLQDGFGNTMPNFSNLSWGKVFQFTSGIRTS